MEIILNVGELNETIHKSVEHIGWHTINIQ